jgi:hypothetical protein
MKRHRLFGALSALLLICSPANAVEQASYVAPIAGPMPMSTFVGTYLNPALRALASCSWGTVAPANGPGAAALPYQCWADTTSNPVVIKIYDGASWVVAAKLNTSSHTWTPSYQGTDLGTASTAPSGTSGHTLPFLDGNNIFSGTEFFSSQFGLSGVISPAALAADQNDYSPTGFSGAAIVRQDGGAADRNITGLAGGAEGRILAIINIGTTNSLVLKDQSASSSATNRFLFGADVTVGPNKEIALRYDAVSGRWRAFDRALVNTGVTAASYGSATQAVIFTVDVQGRISAASNVTITPAFSSLTGSAACSQLPALTGDVTTSAGSCATTLGNIPTGTTAAGSVLWSNIAAPATPAAGKTSTYVDSTAKRFHDKNDAGTIGTTVVGDTGAASNYISAIDPSTGAITKSRPSCATLSDASVFCNGTSAANLTGTQATTTIPAFAGGDVTGAGGSLVLSIGATKVTSAMLNADVFSTAHSWGGVQTLAAPVITGLADFQGAHKDSTQSAPAQITVDQNDYNPSSVVCSSSSTLLINANAARNITGIAGGVAGCDLFVVNNGSFTITLKEENLSSTAGNRFTFGGDFALLSKSAAHLKYDGGSSRWRNTTGSGSGGGAGTVTNVATDTTLTGGPITTSGTLGLSDAYRQNLLLDRIYQAKAFAGYRRFLSAFADGYKASDGIAAGSSSGYTVTTASGFVAPTAVTTRKSGGTPTVPLGGTAANINDNNTGTTSTYTGTNLSAAAQNARIMAQIDYGSNQTITKIEVVGMSQSTGSNSTTGLYYSTDGTTWTQLGSNCAATSTTPTTCFATGSVTARYIAIILPQITFSGANVVIQDFNGYTDVAGSLIVVSTLQTADASVSNGRVLLEFDNSGAPTLNTDLTVEVTCNGGTNWTAATLTSVSSNGQGGHTIAETADTATTAGTSFGARIKTFNAKSVPIYGTSVTVH